MRLNVLLSFIFWICACADVPYGSVKRTPENTSVIGKNYKISGQVYLSAPVVGGELKLFSWPDEKGNKELLASTKTIGDGKFELSFQSAYSGAVLLVVEKGEYAPGATTIFLKDSFLKASMAELNDSSSIFINAWTSLATSKALAEHEKSISVRIESAYKAFGQHLLREGFKWDAIDFCRVLEDRCLNKSSLYSNLSHLGLEEVARKHQLSLEQLIEKLSLDLEDGLINGKNKMGPIYLDWSSNTALSAHSIGSDLAHEIDLFLLEHSQMHDLRDEIQRENLSKDKELFDSLSTDTNPVLFSFNQSLKRYYFKSQEAVDAEKIYREKMFDFEMNSGAVNIEDFDDDIGNSKYSFLDLYNPGRQEGLKNGFSFMHARIKTGKSGVKIYFEPASFNVKIFERVHIWDPRDSKDSLCDFGKERLLESIDGLQYGNQESKIHVFNFRHAPLCEVGKPCGKAEVGEEILPSDYYFILKPQSEYVVRWSIEQLYTAAFPALAQGEIPPRKMCAQEDYSKFVKTCKGKHDKFFMPQCIERHIRLDGDWGLYHTNLKFYALEKIALMERSTSFQYTYQLEGDSDFTNQSVSMEHELRTLYP